MLKPCGWLGRAMIALAALAAVAALSVAPAFAADKVSKADRKAQQAKAKAVSAPAKPAAATKPPKVKPTPKPPEPEPSYEDQKKADGPWAKRTNWLSFRAGYARNSDANAGDGLGGYGVAYQHMMSRKWAFGASVQHDLLGHLGDSYEISVPFTAEFTRHFKLNTAFRPYVGMGGGYYFHKYYRTGPDYTGAPGAGYYVNFGANMPVNDRNLLGVDARISWVAGRDGVVNPVFGPEKATMTLWSIKLNWALAY